MPCMQRRRADTHHPKLVAVIIHEHGPVLRRVGILADVLGDHLSEAGLLGKPLARKAGDGVPANLDGAVLPDENGLARRYDARFAAKPERFLELELPLEQLILSFGEPYLAAWSAG
jgi:hypothetical protein